MPRGKAFLNWNILIFSEFFWQVSRGEIILTGKRNEYKKILKLKNSKLINNTTIVTSEKNYCAGWKTFGQVRKIF